jgi:dUTP pyrophosphatase
MLSRLIECVYAFIDYNTPFKVKLMHEGAIIPQKADNGCAGYDVYSAIETVIKPGTRTLVPIGIRAEIPRHYYLRIAPRSGMSLKGIDIGAGVIDSSYRGEIKVLVVNNGETDFVISKGSKIAQMVMERCANPGITLVDNLSETERGYGGFGSSGN